MRLALLGFVAFIEIQAFALPINLPERRTAADDQPAASPGGSYNFEGIVALSNCSGSLFRFENSKDDDKALVMSNGHCVSRTSGSGFIPPGEFVYNESSTKSFTLLNAAGTGDAGRVQAEKLLYATMTGTDISIYQLKQTYAQIENKNSVQALVLESQHPGTNEEIEILSGYWRRGYSCAIDKFIFKLMEFGYTWNDSMRYSEGGCETIHGTSGSPILSKATHKIVGINNTGNDSGEQCTMDNPCEIDEQGQIYFRKGLSYGQQTHQIYSCLTAGGAFDLSVEGCQLLH